MDAIAIQTLLIGVIVAITTSILGVFLVLRKMSMMIDAISHTILFGIVIAYAITGNLNSPLIFIGATLTGLLTVYLIELLVKTNRTTEDAATGVIYPLLFSIAIILISLFYDDTHLDTHAITGNLELSAFKQITIFGVRIGAQSLYINLFVLIIVLLFVIFLFKELKILTFDKALAYSLGLMPGVIHYLLMTLISLTAVTSFSSVGLILVIAMMIGPAVTSLLITKNLKYTIIVSASIGAMNAILGYFISMYLFLGHVNISSTIAVVTLIVFLLVWFFEPKKGLITTLVTKQTQKKEFELFAFILHIKQHQNTIDENIELNRKTIEEELNWSNEKLEKNLSKAIQLNYVKLDKDIIRLTINGDNYYNLVSNKFI